MPLVVIRRNPNKIDDAKVEYLLRCFPAIAAKELSCEAGGPLDPKDIMIEVDNVGPFDTNVKDLNIRVFAEGYPVRRENVHEIQKRLSNWVREWLLAGISWYVWVFLPQTSYGSDTEP